MDRRRKLTSLPLCGIIRLPTKGEGRKVSSCWHFSLSLCWFSLTAPTVALALHHRQPETLPKCKTDAKSQGRVGCPSLLRPMSLVNL